ncbi:hypothetical protein [Amycolatopsis jiangsuensis]|uniref:Uncharacterized protein n=1 Tax=Amycolatopsis jiangsuensis TaxID=1181879 RepID=A0A840IXW0_9PSEU|nr:hypothetical protein [Amycolatopsis jiangsuensis]MBB4686690.1 hypothetical protein [Amycolatopsis jiangsuensis]
MNDEVPVADLLVREGWGERVPPPSRSRWRMVAVMLAVVVGCGAAAVLVSFGTTAHDEAVRVTEMRVIEMPNRTGGAGGVDETNPATIENSESTVPAGGQETTEDTTPPARIAIDPLNPSDEQSSTESHPATSSAENPDTSSPPGTTSSGPSGTASPDDPPSSSAPQLPPPCLLGILFC